MKKAEEQKHHFEKSRKAETSFEKSRKAVKVLKNHRKVVKVLKNYWKVVKTFWKSTENPTFSNYHRYGGNGLFCNEL